MAYIYKITNKQNNKIYIGKTMLDINKRFQEHCKDAFKMRNRKRPLYRAMKKYGVENFEISLIEECDDNIINEREIYWIEYYHSFKDGYNATLGGDGKHYLDYDLICEIYQELQNCISVAKELNISVDTVRKVLKSRHIRIKTSQEINKELNSKSVDMFDINGNYIETFLSLSDAARFINTIENKTEKERKISVVKACIRRVANEQTKTAYKYKWRWHNN